MSPEQPPKMTKREMLEELRKLKAASEADREALAKEKNEGNTSSNAKTDTGSGGVPPSPTPMPDAWEISPQTPEEREVETEIRNMPEAQRLELSWGLNRIGYNVEKMKDNWFANSLNWGMEKAKIDRKGTLGRFVTELKDSFVRDAEEAEKKGIDIQTGKDKTKMGKVKNIGVLMSNVSKYGRTVFDVTTHIFYGSSIVNPYRYVMLGGQIATRTAEAGKEARFKSDELLEKTQIKDAGEAAEEAWRIYEKAGGKISDGPTTEEAATMTAGFLPARLPEENISADALKNAYLTEMPRDIQERLEDPSVALNFVQKILRKEIEIRLNRLQKKIDGLRYDITTDDRGNTVWERNTTPLEQVEIEKQKLLESWKKELDDYDRMITQYGTVDELAMAAKHAQLAGKGVVLGMQLQTAYKTIMNVPKIFEHISHIFSKSHEEAQRLANNVSSAPKASVPAQTAEIGGKNPETVDMKAPDNTFIHHPINWIEDKIHGIKNSYYEDGKLEYRNDHGDVEHFDESGKIIDKTFQDGHHDFYTAEGKIKTEILNGFRKDYYPDGKLRIHEITRRKFQKVRSFRKNNIKSFS